MGISAGLRASRLLLGLLSALLPAAVAAPEERPCSVRFPIVEDGRAIASVLVGEAGDLIAAAVADLESYAERIAGARLEVIRGSRDVLGPTLHVGEGRLSAEYGGGVVPRNRPTEFAAIRRVGAAEDGSP